MINAAMNCRTVDNRTKSQSAPERQFAFSEAKYRGLLEAAPDAMVVVDESGAIALVDVQAEKQFGCPRDELIGRKVTDIIPSGVAERLVADKLRSPEEALAQVISAGIELTALRKDGGEFPIEIMLSPLESSDGILATAPIRDISRRKAAEAGVTGMIAELKRSNEELGQFAYIASHDLQEPLRMVSSYTQLPAQRYAGNLDADADDYLRKPFDPDELVVRVEALAGKCAARRSIDPPPAPARCDGVGRA